jgi:hypothetical protein
MSTPLWWWKNSKSLDAFNRSCDAYQMLCWGVQKVYIQKKCVSGLITPLAFVAYLQSFAQSRACP